MPLDRAALRAHLDQALRPQPWALAFWEGGSAAFGRLDAFSDLDLGLIVEDHAVSEAFAQVEAALSTLSPIADRWVAAADTDPKPQRYYRTRDTDPHLLIDLGVFPVSTPATERFLEPRRHGHADVIFDKGDHTQTAPPDPVAFTQHLASRVRYLRDRVALLRDLPLKAARRGEAAEALLFYQAFCLRPLTELLRIQHDPWRHDFDVRYLRYDLPAPVRERLWRLYFVSDLNALVAHHAEAQARLQDLFAELDAAPPGVS